MITNHEENDLPKFRMILVLLLIILNCMVFTLRTLSTPILLTVTIDDPKNNFNTKDAVLTGIGILLGGFASYQYCGFMWKEGRSAINNIVNNVSSFFYRGRYQQLSDLEHRSAGSPLIDDDNLQRSGYGSINNSKS